MSCIYYNTNLSTIKVVSSRFFMTLLALNKDSFMVYVNKINSNNTNTIKYVYIYINYANVCKYTFI